MQFQTASLAEREADKASQAHMQIAPIIIQMHERTVRQVIAADRVGRQHSPEFWNGSQDMGHKTVRIRPWPNFVSARLRVRIGGDGAFDFGDQQFRLAA